MPVSFDMAGLSNLIDRTHALVGADFKLEVSQVLAAGALKEVSDSFRYSRDPYGKPWRPLAWRKGQPLLDTGRMRASVFPIRISPDGFGIRIGATYAAYHQSGARTRKPARGRPSRARVGSVPQRMMVPEGGQGIGPIWFRTFARDAGKVITRRLRGA
jgi:phage gpG-like protein